MWLACLLSLAACSGDKKPAGPDAAAGGGGSGGTLAPLQCQEDDVWCDGSVAKICDGKGGYKSSQDCGASAQACVSSRLNSAGVKLQLGCVKCTPGEASCAQGTAKLCREDGSGFDVFDCDALQGMTCAADGCKGACAPPEVTTSYIGCDYYPTVSLNPVWQGFDFAVAVSNASDAPAHVVVSRGEAMVRELTVGVDALEIVKLPWVTELKGGDQNACQIPPDPGSSRVVKDGAYRLRSDRPVTVYQFSPLQYQLGTADNPPEGCPVGTMCPGGVVGDCLSFSNDASLLLPATALTGDYSVVSWPSRGNTASYFAVTATTDGTRVSVEGRGSFRPGGGVDGDGQGEIVLDRGDVLEVVASHGTSSADASGSRVTADKPVQVIGGHSCANVPDVTTSACDHLEEALFPTQILGDEYVVTYPAAVASQSPHVIRILAPKPNTHIAFEPALSEEITLGPDDQPFELRIGAFERGGSETPPRDVHIKADKPILIAQYMQGLSSVPSGAGDPSLSLAVPTAQYRKQYIFTASTTYDANFINVIAPSGTSVRLDGQPLSSEATAVGASSFSVTRVRLPKDGSGVHRIEGDAPFGLVVYGYGRFTSYMYPGGLDLKRITVVGPD